MSSATARSGSPATPDSAASRQNLPPGFMPRRARPRVRPRVVAGFALVLLAAVGAVVVGLLVGPAHISVAEAVSALARRLTGKVDLLNWRETVVVGVRLPRVLVGFVAGGALAVAGAALQGLFRNPLAEPGVLGISSGASLGAVLAIYFHIAGKAVWLLPACAFAGAALDAVLVFAIAAHLGRGRVFTGTVLLVGVALMALNISMTTFVLSISLASYNVGREVMYWLLGGLEGRTWDHLLLGGPAVVVGTIVIAAHARDLDALLLGEVSAQSVGVDVPRVRMRLVLASALVVGAAVAVAGPIGFVGLLVPHVLRLAVGAPHTALVPLSFFGGGIFLVIADVVARSLSADLPVGVVTAAVGAPVFLALLVRRRVEVAGP
ncbi:MAG TPA: iron ABC transporter permease [Polyangia bacterium]|jgi:iron complex transport system permease protein|nr:iron ABC transporter permease [Polyangia bacterium]